MDSEIIRFSMGKRILVVRDFLFWYILILQLARRDDHVKSTPQNDLFISGYRISVW